MNIERAQNEEVPRSASTSDCLHCSPEEWRACELLHSVVKSVPDILFYKDLAGVYLGGNQQLAEVVGRPLADIIGKTDIDLFPKEVAEEYRKNDRLVMSSQEPHRNEEWILRPDGSRVVCDTRKVPLRDGQGKLVGLLGVSRDITERKLAEERLRASEANWAALFSSLRDFLFILDYEGQILCVNPVVLDSLGYSEGELLGKPFSFVFPDDRREQAETLFREMAAKRQLASAFPLLTKDGRQIPADTRVSFGQWNGQDAVFAVSRDVSERVEAERAFHRLNYIQSQLMNLATEFVNVPVNRQDEAVQQALAMIGSLTNADRAYVFIYHFDRGIMTNTHEWCAPGISSHIQELQQVPLSISPLVERHMRGESVHISDVDEIVVDEAMRKIVERKGLKSVVAFPLYAGGECMGSVGFEAVTQKRVWGKDEIALLRMLAVLLANFSLRRKAEEELRRSSDERGMLLDTMDAQVYYLTNAETYGLVNRAHAEFLGRPKEQIENHPRDAFIPPALVDEFKALRRKIFETGEPEHAQAWLTNARGEERLLEVRLNPKKADDGQRVEYVVAVAYDVTEMKQLQDRLGKACDEAVAAASAKSLFLANMSHEIRTPLNAILGYAQLMTRSCRSCAINHRGIEAILKNGEHLLSLLNGILVTARSDNFQEHLEPADFDFYELLEEVRLFSVVEPASPDLLVSAEWSERVPKWLRADRGKIRQVLINLIGNALKFTARGSVRIAADVAESVEPQGAQQKDASRLRLVVLIADTGQGISGEFLPHLFELFAQDVPANDGQSGVGLGLPISRRIALALGGDISVQSVVGKGSTFCFTFQAEEGRAPVRGAGDAESIIGLSEDETERRVLIVDDDEGNRFMLQKMLKRAGFVTCLAASGKEALERLAHDQPFDVVMMDKRMPGLNGLETVRLIREMPARKALPILLVTAADLSELDGLDSGAGINGVVRKPLSRAQLLLEIQRVTGARYRYENDSKGSFGSKTGTSLRAPADSALRDLAPEFRAQMERAVSRGDISALRNAVESVRISHPLLAEQLMALVRRYDYDALQKLLAPSRNGDENEKI